MLNNVLLCFIYLLFVPIVFGFLSTALADGYGKNRRWYIWNLAILWPASVILGFVVLVVFGIIVGTIKICDRLVELGEAWGREFS